MSSQEKNTILQFSIHTYAHEYVHYTRHHGKVSVLFAFYLHFILCTTYICGEFAYIVWVCCYVGFALGLCYGSHFMYVLFSVHLNSGTLPVRVQVTYVLYQVQTCFWLPDYHTNTHVDSPLRFNTHVALPFSKVDWPLRYMYCSLASILHLFTICSLSAYHPFSIHWASNLCVLYIHFSFKMQTE